jgi:hypothetical protein
MNTKRNVKWLIHSGLGIACTLAVVLIVTSWGKKTHAQDQDLAQAYVPVHMTTDWSNRHMVYSAPPSAVAGWRLQAEPRYVQQLARRAAPGSQANFPQ